MRLNHRSLVRLLLAVIAALALMAGSASQASATPGALKILLADAEGSGFATPPTTFTNQLRAQPGVASVDFFNASLATPTAAQLHPYDVVAIENNYGWFDPVAMGNVIADYQDQGGVVVGATYTWQMGETFGGRWITGNYSPYQTNAASSFSNATLGTHDSSSPLLAGVSSLTAYYRDTLLLTPGTTEIARWSDGISAVAYKGHAVGINSNYDDSYGQFGGDLAKIVVNAGNVLGPTFSLGGVKRNKHKGTAFLSVNVPGPGTLSLAGKAVKTQRVGGGAVASKTVTAAGIVNLLVKAKGNKKRKLNKRGKVKVGFNVTYAPVGGSPSTPQFERVKLVKKH